MNWSRVRVAGLVAALGVLQVACDNGGTNSPLTPTPTVVTDTFSGTLVRNGATAYPFTVGASGTVTVALTSMDPQTTIGVAVGTWTGTVCGIVLANDAAKVGDTLVGTAGALGSLCVRVYDATGALDTPVSYTITVTHP